MKLPIDWLREFVTIEETPQALADIFTNLGFEAHVINDKLLNLEITPNRGDCLSVVGLAREYAACKNKPLRRTHSDEVFNKRSQTVKITADSTQCYRYAGIILEHVASKKSSRLIQQRLQAVGITPHNAIIDITNYVMIETGQPLHAFDLDQIKGNMLNIRAAKNNETLKILSGEILKLTPDALIIEDSKDVIDLAGIMGGYASAVSKKTKRVLLQAAMFDPKIIRSSIKSTGVTTDASHRYERYVDHNLAPAALNLAIKLIKQEKIAAPKEFFDIKFKRIKERSIELNYQKINQLLATHIDPKLVRNYLGRLGCAISELSPKKVSVVVPSYRFADLFLEQDLVEEIARLHGYHRIPKRLIRRTQTTKNTAYDHKRALIQTLSAHGFQQIISYSLIAQSQTNALGITAKDLVVLENPISPAQSLLRPNLLIGALKAIQKNAWWPHAGIFEIGNVFMGQHMEEHAIVAATPKLDKKIVQAMPKMNISAITPSDPIAKLLKLRQAVAYIEAPLQDWQPMIKQHTNAVFALPR
ncbi:phenylalanine--tRNA ligase subunit beta, partial [Candidatus Berkelbacteria bacterium]|nr:phenylalanine--tRNA ligase subunit beta [Candidatus Berkelbacteria bacterium]